VVASGTVGSADPGGSGANLADLLRAAATRRPDTVALVDHDASGARAAPTWAELDAAVDAAAAGIRGGLGLHPGHRVALALANSGAFVTAYFGALRAGLVVVPVNTGLTSHEVAQLLSDSQAHAVFCDDSTQHVVEEAVVGTHRAVVDPAGLDSLVSAGRAAAGPGTGVTGGEDTALLLFTSGTSGRPKGAMLSHRALIANIRQCGLLEPAPVAPDDVVLVVLPLFHVYGLGVLGQVTEAGATAVLVDRFDVEATSALVSAEHVTNIPGAPPMYVAWSRRPALAEQLRGVRVLASGAAPLPVTVSDAIRSATGLVVHEGYGLTETAPVVTTTMASASVKPGSVGRPVPGVQVRLVDEDGDDVADGDPGEIVVRGANLFSGYWPDGADGPDETGWYATGDVAYADDDGDLFLVDRRKELVLVSGFNVYPREIEDVLAEHPDIAESAVIAVPDPETGEAVKAFVVPRRGSSLSPQDVLDHCAHRLARFKRPSVVVVVDGLPHSATGKVAKGRLRAGDVGPGQTSVRPP
jgi:long-chain acyl-CoA synthetase